MLINVVTAVRLNAKGVPTEFMMGKAEGAVNEWAVKPAPIAASDVADMLLAGEKVATVFEVDGLRVAGPWLRYRALEIGTETAELDGEPVQGRTLNDLPKMA